MSCLNRKKLPGKRLLKTGLKTYQTRSVPLKTSILTQREINIALHKAVSDIRACPTKMSVAATSSLLGLAPNTIKRVINRYIDLFKNYYDLAIDMDKSKIIAYLDIKVKADPILYFALIAAIFKFTNHTEDPPRLKDCEVIRNISKRAVRISVPRRVASEGAALRKICRSRIEQYPDVLLYLMANYATRESKEGATGTCPALLYIAEIINNPGVTIDEKVKTPVHKRKQKNVL